MKLKRLLLLLPIALSASIASASMISDSATLGSNLSPIPTEFDYGTYTFTLDKFDGALGTLQSVHLIFNSTATYSLYFQAGGTGMTATGAAGGLRVGVSMNVTGPDDFMGFGFDANSLLHSAVASRVVPNQNLAANTQSSIYTNGGSPSTSNSTYDIDPAAFSYWTGTSGDTIQLQIKGINSLSNVASVTGSYTIVGSGTVYGDVTVQYTYQEAVATPEPATMGLMGTALIGAFFFRKRFKK